MNFHRLFFPFVFVACLALLPSCADDPVVEDPDPVEVEDKLRFSLNGGSFNNTFVSFQNINTLVTGAKYNAETGVTEIEVLGTWNNVEAYFQVVYPGKEVTAYEFLDQSQGGGFPFVDNEAFQLRLNTINQLYVKQFGFTIDEYGELGEAVKGHFWGQLFDYSAGPAQTVNIINASFEVVRAE